MTHTADGGDWHVTRRVLTARPVDETKLGELAGLCADEDGVRAVSRGNGMRQLRVRYDASRIHYRAVQQWLRDQGIALRPGRWSRWLAAWYEMQDENLREASRTPPAACCNRPPGRH